MHIKLHNAGLRKRRANRGVTASDIKSYFESCSPVVLTGIASLAVLIIGVIDLVTGTEIALSIFYLIPIAFATWYAGRAPGLMTAVLSALTWLAADLANAPAYSHPAIPFWNAAVRLGIFLLMARLLSSIRSLTGNLEQAVQKKTALLSAEIKARKDLQKEVTELTTKQRQAIAYELHDGLCPLLGGIAMKAKMLHENLADRASPDADCAGELVSLLKNANQQARLLARGLDPIAVELHGLTSALAKLATETERSSRVKCAFKTNLARVPVSPSIALQLYRIAQEAIHNACVHGGARCIHVELSHDASHPDRGLSQSAARRDEQAVAKTPASGAPATGCEPDRGLSQSAARRKREETPKRPPVWEANEPLRTGVVRGSVESARGLSQSAAAPSVAGVEQFGRDAAAAAAANGNGSRLTSGRLRLKIIDDGKGFCLDRLPAEGLGLRIMRFRAECIGAVLWIESSRNQGTTVQCCLAVLEEPSADVRPARARPVMSEVRA